MRSWPTRRLAEIKSKENFQEWVSFLSIFVVSGLVMVGTFRAYTRGGNDFSVFYEAWKLVIQGQGADVYRLSPDRFLYSPGFAWILSPIALLPKPFALGAWCLLKAFILGWIVKKFALSLSRTCSKGALAISCAGAILIAKPLLIDFEYGQVNLMIVGVCVWSLLRHFEPEQSNFKDMMSWSLLTFVALAKLFPLPVLLVPWVVTANISPKKLKFERWTAVLTLSLLLIFPVFSVGWNGMISLYTHWQEALLDRGLPLESHNQSFTAFLYHYLSGSPTLVRSEGMQPLLFGKAWLSFQQISLLSLCWSFLTSGFMLGWILAGSNHPPLKWTAILIGLLITPSHLVWKPYFVMSLPMAILLMRESVIRKDTLYWIVTFLLFVGINFTGFDFVGHAAASHFEAASLLLILHLLIMGMVLATRDPVSL